MIATVRAAISTPYRAASSEGTLGLALRNRFGQHVGRITVDGSAGRKLARVDADHPTVVCPRGHVIRLRAQESGSPCGEPRFCLGDVSTCQLAGIIATACLLQLLGEHFDVAAIQREDRRVTQQVHVSGCGVEQDLLFGGAQSLAGGADLAFGLADAVGGLVTVEQRVGDVGTDGTRIKCLGSRTPCEQPPPLV